MGFNSPICELEERMQRKYVFNSRLGQVLLSPAFSAHGVAKAALNNFISSWPLSSVCSPWRWWKYHVLETLVPQIRAGTVAFAIVYPLIKMVVHIHSWKVETMDGRATLSCIMSEFASAFVSFCLADLAATTASGALTLLAGAVGAWVAGDLGYHLCNDV